jgi:hypothetical protein
LAVLPGLIDDTRVKVAVAVEIGESHTATDEIIKLLAVTRKRHLGLGGNGTPIKFICVFLLTN